MHGDENRRAVFLTSSPVFWGRMEVGVERRSAGGLFSALPRPDFFAMRAPMQKKAVLTEIQNRP
jgi:hypothetical protein